MYNYFAKLISLLSAILFGSCSCVFYPDFKITDFSYSENYVKVVFSSKPNFQILQNSFYLLQDEVSQKGYFTQAENSIFFFPSKGITKNHDYELVISTDAENIDGISLQRKYTKTFTTRTKTLPLKILSSTKTQSGYQFEFSSSVDDIQFRENFSISPEIQYSTNWNADNTVVNLKFQKSLSPKEEYKISISTELTDIYNNYLETKYVHTFYSTNNFVNDFDFCFTKNDNQIILSQTSTNEPISTEADLYFQFYNEIDKESFPASITISPSLDYKISQSTTDFKKYTLSFTEEPIQNLTYNFSITYDGQQEQITKNYSLQFDYSVQRPTFLFGAINVNNTFYDFSESNNFNTIEFPVDQFPTVDSNETTDIEVYFIFSKTSVESPILLSSAIENISMYSTNNCLEITPFSISFVADQDLVNQLFENSSFENQDIDSLSVINFTCHVENKDVAGLIKIQIDEELCDSNLVSIDETKLFSINKI